MQIELSFEDYLVSADKEKLLNEVLREIKTSTPYIEGLIILSWEGLTIASNFKSSAEEEVVAAMCATLISLGENFCNGFKRGDFEHVFLRSKDLYDTEKAVILGKITNESVLAMITKSKAKLGVLIYELSKARSLLSKILGE
jgi:predicted regulator of Ras-like GTPase activity (Roadblock/LC7/MglB family)